ncbi:MAG: class I SAM-dependent methyltransferase [Clostridia bacterium]|nr:class I SAM-dependent methyltransferase [Clostridia bacterium]
MSEKTVKDNQTLIDFWDKAFAMRDDGKNEEVSPEAWKDMAPSAKLFKAAQALGTRKKVLDYGCGSGWASVIAAKSGAIDVTAVDPAPGAAKAAVYYAAVFGVEDQVHASCIAPDWLRSVPANTYDGFICSNVLDVVPPETAEEIIRGSARVVTRDADVIIGLNYYLSPEAAAQRGIELQEGNRVYMDGVLRLVSRTDEEWAKIFAPYYTVEKLEHFAWPGETAERRRLFWLRKREDTGDGNV